MYNFVTDSAIVSPLLISANLAVTKSFFDQKTIMKNKFNYQEKNVRTTYVPAVIETVVINVQSIILNSGSTEEYNKEENPDWF